MRRDDLAAEVDVGVAALGEEQRFERGARRDRRHERLGDGGHLRGEDLARLLERALAVGDVAFDVREVDAVRGHVEEPRLDLPSGTGGRRRRGSRRCVAGRLRAALRQHDEQHPHEHGGDGRKRAEDDRPPHQGVPPPGSVSRNRITASTSAATTAF